MVKDALCLPTQLGQDIRFVHEQSLNRLLWRWPFIIIALLAMLVFMYAMTVYILKFLL